MAFPASLLPLKHELLINGVWTDITSDVRGQQGYGGIQVTRGFSGEQSQLSAGLCAFAINNRNGKYTNKNPMSAYYRMLGRNTQFRTGIDTGTVGMQFLDMATVGTSTYDGSVAWTADKAALDITGDIDIAVDFDAIDWRGRHGHILASKYLLSGNQRSWLFGSTTEGYLQLIWSPDGTAATRIFATCPVRVNPTGRVQYRVQLDVNNGSGGWTCSFYVGDGTGITGTYTLLGSTSAAGTTSIFSSSARLEVGDANNGGSWSGAVSNIDPFAGVFYGMLLRNGIAGTTVAAFRPDLQAAGTTTWVDTASNTWTVTGSSYLSSANYRFYGEVPSLPNRWDTSGTDIYIPIQSADIIQRLTSGNNLKPLESPVKRNLKQFAWNGYWPMEQNFSSDNITAYIGQTGFKNSADFSPQPDGFDGSAGSMIFNDDSGTAGGICASSTGTPVTTTFLFYFRFDTLPPSAAFVPIIEFFPQGGTAGRITIYANNAGYKTIVISPDGTALITSNPGGYGGLGYSPVNWTAMRIKLSASGGTISFEWAWYQVNGVAPVGLTDSYSGTMGRPRSWLSESFTGKFGLELAHVAMGSFDFDFTGANFISSTNAFRGELWTARARRLAAEQLEPLYIEGLQEFGGDTSFIATMGVQPLKTYVELQQECAAASGGILYVPRNKPGLVIRSWQQMIMQDDGPQLDYSLNHLSGELQPEPDTFLIENDVTLTTPDGSSYRFVKTSGALNVGDPGGTDPDAVGTYDVSDSINVDTIDDLQGATQRRVAFGTQDVDRYPQVQVNLERAPFVASATLTAICRRLDLGRPFTLINLPDWLPPDDAELMTRGYVETYGGRRHEIIANTNPRGGWSGGTWSSTTQTYDSIWGAKSTTLKTGVNTTATSLTFTTPDEFETWSTTVFGYHVEIAGERMTVTAMGARSGSGPYNYVATVVRSVNAVVKSLNAAEVVTVIEQGDWA